MKYEKKKKYKETNAGKVYQETVSLNRKTEKCVKKKCENSESREVNEKKSKKGKKKIKHDKKKKYKETKAG